jgi:hypothetical protein
MTLVKDFVLIKKDCPVCNRARIATTFFNLFAKPENRVDIIDVDSSDDRIKIIEEAFGLSKEDIRAEGFLPAGVINGKIFQFIKSIDHFYQYLKTLKDEEINLFW